MCLTAPNRRRVETSTMGAQPCSMTRFLIEFVFLGLVFAALPRISGTTDASDGTFYCFLIPFCWFDHV